MEIKNSIVGPGSKVPHLSYVGRHGHRRRARTSAPARSPPTTTAARKHRTTIGDRVRDLRRHRARRARDASATTPTRRPARSSPTTCRRARSGVARAAPDATSRATPSAREDGDDARAATRRPASAPGITLADHVSALDPQPVAGTSINLEYGKRLMLFSGRANPALAARIAGKLNVDLGGVTLKTFSNGEVYCRYEESIRGADVFIVQPTCANPQEGVNAERRADGADGDDRRGGRRLRAPRDRRHAVVRLQPPGQEVGAARADHRPPRRPHARGRRAPTACSRWTSTPARCRASSRSRWTT